jgi:hypothetical protein
MAARPNTTPYGQEIEDNRLQRIWRELTESSDFAARRAELRDWNASQPNKKRGIAITPVKFGISFTTTHLNQAGALVLLYQDGTVQINHGGTEMGQGVYSNIALIAARELGLTTDRVRVMATRTDKVPNTSATAASCGTDLNGAAVKNACDTLRARLLPFAEEMLGEKSGESVAADKIVFNDNMVLNVDDPASGFPFAELLQRAYFARTSLSATGFYRTPEIHYDQKTGRGKPFHYFAVGAAVSEVEVDGFTGMMHIRRVDILHDVGDAVNRGIARGQVEGGFVQGAGWLTMEELVWDSEGRLRTHSPDTYKIPAIGDTPDIFNVAFLTEATQSNVVHGSKAVGRTATHAGDLSARSASRCHRGLRVAGRSNSPRLTCDLRGGFQRPYGAHERCKKIMRNVQHKLSVARGEKAAELIFKNAQLVNVLSGEIYLTNVAVDDGRVVGLGEYDGRETIDLEGAFLAPSLIDGHFHVESTMLTIPEFVRAAVPHGTGAMVIDPHEYANVLGLDGIRYVLESSKNLPVDFFIMLPSCVPATHLETAGARFTADDLALMIADDRIAGVAELMNYPGVFLGMESELAKIRAGKGKAIDGHAPGLRGKNLNAYALAGVRSDHESTEFEEAQEKLRLGLHLLVREGSTERNLEHIISLVTPQNSANCSFATDDKLAGDLVHEGHLDHSIRRAIELGIAPMTAIQMGSINTARHYRLRNHGAIAPRFWADFLVLDDLEKFQGSPRLQERKTRGGKRTLSRGKTSADNQATEHDEPSLFCA